MHLLKFAATAFGAPGKATKNESPSVPASMPPAAPNADRMIS